MKIPIKLTSLLLGFFFTFNFSNAQCYTVSLNSQAEVDDWVAANPTCTTVHNLWIKPSGSTTANINDLSGLSNIQTITGGLTVEKCPNLTTLQGLHNITNIGSTLRILDNPQLVNLDGLNSLGFANEIRINNNDGLQDFVGFENLQTAGTVRILSNHAVNSLNGLNNLDSLKLLSIYDHPLLLNMQGLDSLKVISFDLILGQNSIQQNFVGLENLKTIGRDLSIESLPQVTSLAGFENLVSVEQSVQIRNNLMLSNLQELSSLVHIGGEVTIENNLNMQNLLGLENITELHSVKIINNPSLLSLAGLENLNSVTNTLWIQENTMLTNLQGLNNLEQVGYEFEIQGNDTLQNLLGLENLVSVGGPFSIEENAMITNLQGLNTLEQVGLEFKVTYNQDLENLAGVENLYSVGSLFILVNNSLSTISGLSNLDTIISRLYMSQNHSLTSLEGLENIKGSSILDIDISHVNGLTNLEGLNNLTQVDRFNISYGENLINLEGLDSLTFVHNLLINHHPNLISLDGLNLELFNNLQISYNDVLENLNALSSVTDLSNFNQIGIYHNPHLAECSFYGLCELIDMGVSQNISIGNNALGCNEILEVQYNCGTTKVNGTILFDADQNCQVDIDSIPMSGWKVTADSMNFTKITYTDSLGNYRLGLFEGDYTISVIPPNSVWDICNNSQNISVVSDTTVQFDFLTSTASDCDLLEIDFGTPLLRRCFDNTFTVKWRNVGGTAVLGAYIKIFTQDLFEDFQSAKSFSYDLDSNLIFPLGDLPIGANGQFTFTTTVSCDAIFDQVLCLTAQIYPAETCVPQNSSWSGAELFIDGRCENDTTYLSIENAGQGDMIGPSIYRFYKNAMLVDTGFFQLNLGEIFAINIPADGCTYRLETDQVPEFPVPSFPSITIEGCNILNQSFVTGFFLVHPVEDYGNTFERFCLPVIGAFDPNDKQGFPLGYGDEHFIEQNQPIDFLIRFQNTGTDTAFNVVVLDVLSENFDLSSLEVGAASHPFELQVLENRTLEFSFNNIMLPDSNVNESASHGFFKYSVRQLPDLPLGTRFENSAAIYFDFNDPIITNTTIHELGIVTTVDTTKVILCEGETYQGILYSQNTILLDTSRISIFENIQRTEIQVIENEEIVIDTLLQIGATYKGITYLSDTTFQENLLNQYGCDSIVITNIMIESVRNKNILLTKNIDIQTTPNPFSNIINFNIKNADFDFGKIEIFNVQGKRILEKEFEDAVFALDLENFPSGIYVYKVILNGRKMVGGKLLKK